MGEGKEQRRLSVPRAHEENIANISRGLFLIIRLKRREKSKAKGFWVLVIPLGDVSKLGEKRESFAVGRKRTTVVSARSVSLSFVRRVES